MDNGRDSGKENVMLKWPPRLPDLTSCDFFLWGHVKTLVYVTFLPANVNKLKQRITIALETVAQDMLQRVWEELDYRLDVCRVIGGAHIEHFEIFYGIHVPLNFLFKFTGINLVLVNIKSY